MGTSSIRTKTRRGKRFLENRAPKTIENDKSTLVLRGGKCSDEVSKILHELTCLKKPLVHQLKFRNRLLPFEDASGLEKFSQKFDCSLFLFGSSTKKHPKSLIFGRMFDYRLLDMIELDVENFISSEETDKRHILFGIKPMILLQGTYFETDETMKRVGNLMVDWLRGPVVDTIRLQGLELVVSLTAISEDKLLLRIYRSELKKDVATNIPRIELQHIGPDIDFRVGRHMLASESLFKSATRKPTIIKKASKKNVSRDVFGSTLGRVHLGRQDTEKLQTRKVKALKVK